jgi:hypothetical protein
MSPGVWNRGGSSRYSSGSPFERRAGNAMFLARAGRWLVIAVAIFTVLAILGYVIEAIGA